MGVVVIASHILVKQDWQSTAEAGAIANAYAYEMLQLGELREMERDLVGAESYYRQAAHGGNVQGMLNLGYLLAANGDVVEAQSWLKQATAARAAEAAEASIDH
jgi:Flp pilus assembly protein TadD